MWLIPINSACRELEMNLKWQRTLLGFLWSSVFWPDQERVFGLQAQSLPRGDEEGQNLGQVRRGRIERSVKDLENMRLSTPEGDSYPYSELATFHYKNQCKLRSNHKSGDREMRVRKADKAYLPGYPLFQQFLRCRSDSFERDLRNDFQRFDTR